MLRNPRVWLYAAGGWLILAGLAHTTAHVWSFVLENELYGMRAFAVDAMKQAEVMEPLRPTMWRQFLAFSMGYGLLFYFAGVGNVLLAWTRVRWEALRVFLLLETVFWTVAFGLFAFVEPMLQPVLVCAVAVPLHAIAYTTGEMEAAMDEEG